jgi:hypothetical protein
LETRAVLNFDYPAALGIEQPHSNKVERSGRFL